MILAVILEIISFNVEQISAEAPTYREKLDGIVSSMGAYINDPQIMKYIQNGVSNINFPGMIAGIGVKNALANVCSSSISSAWVTCIEAANNIRAFRRFNMFICLIRL